MNPDNHMASTAGKALDQALGPPPAGAFLKKQAEALVDHMASEKHNHQRSKAIWIGAVAASVAIAVAVIFKQLTAPIPYSIGNTATAQTLHKNIENIKTERLPIVFKNGSRMELFRKSTARVVESDRQRVLVQLESGSLFASINGNGYTEWVVEAGPYQVKVLGTQFTVYWNPQTEELNVDVNTGRVMVEEKGLDQNKILLETGKRLHAERRTGELLIDSRPSVPKRETRAPVFSSNQLTPTPPSSTEDENRPDGIDTPAPVQGTPRTPIVVDGDSIRETQEQKTAEPEPQQKVEAVSSAQSSRKAASPSNASNWKKRVREKDWAGALSQVGLNEIVEMETSATMDELWYLANTLRHQRKAAYAVRLFKALRSRYPDTERSKTALFLIGKITLTILGNKNGAAQWFEQYLREAPKGALREESLGHIMEICVTIKDSACAKRSAARYLNQYKEGVFSSRAQSILSE